MLHRHLAIGFFDVFIAGVFSNAEDFIEVALGHVGQYSFNRWLAKRRADLFRSTRRLLKLRNLGFFHFLDFSINDVVVFCLVVYLTRILPGCLRTSLLSSLACLHVGIHFFAEFLCGDA
jgi:hypothetical protein